MHHVFLRLVDEQVQFSDVHALLFTLLPHVVVDALLLSNLVAETVAHHDGADVLQALFLQQSATIPQQFLTAGDFKY
jgi:hypothetical protein